MVFQNLPFTSIYMDSCRMPRYIAKRIRRLDWERRGIGDCEESMRRKLLPWALALALAGQICQQYAVVPFRA